MSLDRALKYLLRPSGPTIMLINYAAITHRGRVRKNNEDAFLVSALDGEEPLVNALCAVPKHCHAGLLAAVADGMGGAAAGEIASREGLAAFSVNMYSRWGGLDTSLRNENQLWNALRDSARAAGDAVLRYSDAERTARGMGTTLTAALVWEGNAFITQVGDSRAYLLRGEELAQLTHDQTLVNEMLANGLLTEEQARVHPQRSMITQALGTPLELKASLGKFALRRGDRLLLCSDGFHGEAGPKAIHEVLAKRLSPKETLRRLLEVALEAGGRDNITAILLALDDPGFPLPNRKDLPALQPPPPKTFPEAEPRLLARIRQKLGKS